MRYSCTDLAGTTIKKKKNGNQVGTALQYIEKIKCEPLQWMHLILI